MQRGTEKDGTFVLQAAGEEHTHIGLIERHNGMISDVLDGVIDDCQPANEEQYQECLTQACAVKNQHLHKAGTTPEMGVFGRHRRMPGDLGGDEDPITGTLPLFDSGVDFAVKARLSARKRLAEWMGELSDGGESPPSASVATATATATATSPPNRRKRASPRSLPPI